MNGSRNPGALALEVFHELRDVVKGTATGKQGDLALTFLGKLRENSQDRDLLSEYRSLLNECMAVVKAHDPRPSRRDRRLEELKAMQTATDTAAPLVSFNHYMKTHLGEHNHVILRDIADDIDTGYDGNMPILRSDELSDLCDEMMSDLEASDLPSEVKDVFKEDINKLKSIFEKASTFRGDFSVFMAEYVRVGVTLAVVLRDLPESGNPKNWKNAIISLALLGSIYNAPMADTVMFKALPRAADTVQEAICQIEDAGSQS